MVYQWKMLSFFAGGEEREGEEREGRKNDKVINQIHCCNKESIRLSKNGI